MGRHDWYRNTTWDAQIEADFFARLQRARTQKSQYLRIQASSLRERHPDVALRLLEQVFAVGDAFDLAPALVDRAHALLALGQVDAAMESFEQAIAREQEFPGIRTHAWLDLPFEIATRGLRARYDRAFELLEAFKPRLMWPRDGFRWHAAAALMQRDRGALELAQAHAREALAEAGRDDSGFAHHPDLGLVGDDYAGLRGELAGMTNERTSSWLTRFSSKRSKSKR